MDSSNLRFPKPKPPPPFPIPSNSSSFPILAISICGILATSILVLTCYVFVTKCCFSSRRSNVVSRLSRSGMRSENSLTVFPTAIQSRGLEESAIRAIPTFRYRRGRDGDQQGKSSVHDCAVCLNEFQEEESVRLLPNCFHVFHLDCIDTWLQTNANCPLCRSDITTTSPIPDDHFMDFASIQSLQHSGDTAIDINNDGGHEVQPVTSSTNTDPSPMKAEQGRVGHKRGGKNHHVSSVGDECIDVRSKDELFSIQPIRRSFSMDSSSDRHLYMEVQRILQQNPHFQEVRNEESSSNSGRIGRSFFSFGQCRISKSAVLPFRNEV